MVIVLIIGICLIAFGLFLLLKGIYKLILAVYYWNFAKEKFVDEAYKNHVIGKSDEYKDFSKRFDKGFRDGI